VRDKSITTFVAVTRSASCEPSAIYIDGKPPAPFLTETDCAPLYEAEAEALHLALLRLPLGTWRALRNLILLGRIR
jgi:hypothetical protein